MFKVFLLISLALQLILTVSELISDGLVGSTSDLLITEEVNHKTSEGTEDQPNRLAQGDLVVEDSVQHKFILSVVFYIHYSKNSAEDASHNKRYAQ
jgi:hypothetical protein